MTFVSLLFTIFLTQATKPVSHPIEFWRAVVAHEFMPPAGSDVPALTTELSDMLASPDPELREPAVDAAQVDRHWRAGDDCGRAACLWRSDRGRRL